MGTGTVQVQGCARRLGGVAVVSMSSLQISVRSRPLQCAVTVTELLG